MALWGNWVCANRTLRVRRSASSPPPHKHTNTHSTTRRSAGPVHPPAVTAVSSFRGGGGGGGSGGQDRGHQQEHQERRRTREEKKEEEETHTTNKQHSTQHRFDSFFLFFFFFFGFFQNPKQHRTEHPPPRPCARRRTSPSPRSRRPGLGHNEIDLSSVSAGLYVPCVAWEAPRRTLGARVPRSVCTLTCGRCTLVQTAMGFQSEFQGAVRYVRCEALRTPQPPLPATDRPGKLGGHVRNTTCVRLQRGRMNRRKPKPAFPLSLYGPGGLPYVVRFAHGRFAFCVLLFRGYPRPTTTQGRRSTLAPEQHAILIIPMPMYTTGTGRQTRTP